VVLFFKLRIFLALFIYTETRTNCTYNFQDDALDALSRSNIHLYTEEVFDPFDPLEMYEQRNKSSMT